VSIPTPGRAIRALNGCWQDPLHHAMIGSMDHAAGHNRGYLDPRPLSVLYAYALLWVQAGMWAVAALGTVAVCADKANWEPATRSPAHLAWFIAASILLFALTAGLSAGSAFLGVRLMRGAAGARITAVVLETLMTCFGALIANYTASSGAGITAAVPVLAGLVGAALSLAAAIGLLRKHARHFTKD